MTATANTTKDEVLAAAKEALIESGYSGLSTRRIADKAGVPLSQIHYHFGSRHNLVLAVLAEENRRLLERQRDMYSSDQPLWQQWERACDFLDEDLESGYVRVLQEMIAAGWCEPEIAEAVRAQLKGWFDLLTTVAESAADLLKLRSAEPADVAYLIGMAFLGAEAVILLGFEEDRARQALRSVGDLIRRVEQVHAG